MSEARHLPASRRARLFLLPVQEADMFSLLPGNPPHSGKDPPQGSLQALHSENHVPSRSSVFRSEYRHFPQQNPEGFFHALPCRLLYPHPSVAHAPVGNVRGQAAPPSACRCQRFRYTSTGISDTKPASLPDSRSNDTPDARVCHNAYVLSSTRSSAGI